MRHNMIESASAFVEDQIDHILMAGLIDASPAAQPPVIVINDHEFKEPSALSDIFVSPSSNLLANPATAYDYSTNVTVTPSSGSQLSFNLTNTGGVTPNSQAEMGFIRAAKMWQGYLSDNVTININVGFASLAGGVLGQTSSTSQIVTYSQVRSALTSDQTSSDDAAAVASLSAGSSLSFYTNNSAGTRVFDNDGSANNTYLSIKSANLKALGITSTYNGTAIDPGATDASISFSSDYAWDYDPSDGISAGAYDFVGAAFHEIGHALGFVSGVDTVDYNNGSGPGRSNNYDLNGYVVFSALDLFRYSANGVRDLSYNTASYFSLNGGTTNLALFSTGDYQGDGNQASHWKDDLGIGIMDPTLGSGQLGVVTARDIQAFDVIGWNKTSPSASNLKVVNDFNADGRSDLLFRNINSGVFTEWQSTGNSFTPNVAVNGTVSNAWHSEGSFDFSGDRQADLLWRNDATGQFSIWNSTGNGFSPNSYTNSSVSPAWNVAALADFNGDGKSDIIFRNTNGTFTEWQSTGSGFTQNVVVDSTVGTDWHLTAAADFNGDGRADLLWRNNNGTFSEWQSTGNGFTRNVVVNNTVGTDWHVIGTGDFNGDGRADVLFRNNNGTFTEWQSTGNGFTSNVYVNSSVGNDWSIAQIGDFNADGRDDLIWRNTNGTFTEWQSTGNSFTPNVAVNSNVSTDWKIITHQYDLV